MFTIYENYNFTMDKLCLVWETSSKITDLISVSQRDKSLLWEQEKVTTKVTFFNAEFSLLRFFYSLSTFAGKSLKSGMTYTAPLSICGWLSSSWTQKTQSQDANIITVFKVNYIAVCLKHTRHQLPYLTHQEILLVYFIWNLFPHIIN